MSLKWCPAQLVAGISTQLSMAGVKWEPRGRVWLMDKALRVATTNGVGGAGGWVLTAATGFGGLGNVAVVLAGVELGVDWVFH
jgi:hypothetical protein